MEDENMKKKNRLLAGMIAVTLSLSAFVVSDNSVVRAAEDGVQMYRMYNPTNGEHLHTKDANERNVLITKGWNYEGVSFIVADSGSPVYRLFNRYSGEHHYTMDEGEKDWLTSLGWNYEGIGWYSNKTGDECEVEVYRLFNPYSTDAINSHHYTLDEGERDWLTSLGWNYEGTSWVSMHDVATVDDVEPTCVSTGYSGKAVCKTCGKEYAGSTLPINADNHIHTTYHPSESKEITGVYVCKTCGEVFSRGLIEPYSEWDFQVGMMNHFNNYHGDNVTEKDLNAWTSSEWYYHYRDFTDLYPHYTITIPAYYHCDDCGKDIH